MATWPSTLPAPLVDGYGIEPVEQTVATVMEVGTQRVRRRSFAQVDTVRFAVNLSDTQMAIFRAWLYSTDGADGGAGWFTINIWVGRGGSEAIEARFKGSPKWDMTGNHRWIVTGQIETRPYTASWLDYFAAAELPSMDLDFAKGAYSYFDGSMIQTPSNPFASFITFTRPTTASYIGADGLLKTAAINEPRIEYDPITGECKGLLIEESRTNLLKYSDVSTGWNIVRASNVQNAAGSPDGTNTATLIKDNADNNSHYVFQLFSKEATPTTYVLSVYAKMKELRYIRLTSQSSSYQGSKHAHFDLLSGVPLGTNADSSMEDIGDGWYRCSLIFTTNEETSQRAEIYVTKSEASINYTGDGTSGLYIWGAQLEVGSFPTSYIKTEASAVTRGADNARVTGANFSSWYRQDEGTILAGYRGPSLTWMGADRVVAMSDGTFNNHLTIRGSSKGSVSVVPTVTISGTALNMTHTLLNVSAKNITTLGYKAGDHCAASNGGEFATNGNATALPLLSRMDIGSTHSGSGQLNGHISRLTYWPKRLANTKLQELSA